jgi:hypothetical protein
LLISVRRIFDGIANGRLNGTIGATETGAGMDSAFAVLTENKNMKQKI